MINYGIRQSFENIEQIKERFFNLKLPIELALPYYWEIYQPIRPHLAKIAEEIKGFHINILGIHAVQAPITNRDFRIWGKEIADFALTLNTKQITLHPNNINKTLLLQKEAFKNLKYLNSLYGDDIIFSVETFSGRRRIFTPTEIMEFKLPMTLDVAHIHDTNLIWDLIKNYKENIVTVHLSGKDNTQHHLPIDDLCKEVVDYLVKNKWRGNIILEYLYEFHDKMIKDLQFLKNKYNPI